MLSIGANHMNRAYKLVWNTVSNSWIVASELAKSGKKSSGKALKLALVTAAAVASAGAFAVAPPAAGQLPVGELGVNGTVTFDRSVTNQLTMNQTSASAMTIWESFDVGSNAKVIINQPNSSSVSFNTVLNPTAVTQIFGQVQSNGQFILTNPSGIIFGAGSQVSASSIVAASLQWDSAAGGYVGFTKVGNTGRTPASIENYGSLTATDGSVTLLSPNIINQGSIQATGGNVNLLFADDVDISNATPSIVTASTTQSFIQNSGSITATQVSAVGGKILLTGDTSQSSSQIQLAGTLDATTNTNVNGRSILVNGDVNLNGTSNVLDLTSTDGYSLTNGAALNLNGASSGFSVNGTAYTVIRDVDQLQAMSSNVAGKYVLASNIDASDTVNWNSGAGFVPVGSAGSSFSGVLDGLGHEVSGLFINLPANNYVGLFGYVKEGVLRNVGVVNANITGGGYVGGLIGYLAAVANKSAQVNRAYSSGTVKSAQQYDSAGGLIGQVDVRGDNASINISNVYSSAAVTGDAAGGLIGRVGSLGVTTTGASITLTDAYATGQVSEATVGSGQSGGLIGFIQTNTAANIAIDRVYATGAVSGSSAAAGLISGFYNLGGTSTSLSMDHAFWNTDSSGQQNAFKNNWASDVTVLGTLQGLNATQFKQAASYSVLGNALDAQGGTAATWRIYEGLSGPLLRTFLKPLNLTVNTNVTKTYDATSYTGGAINYTINDSYDSSKLLGTATLAGSALNARNAGTYNLDMGGLYSSQNGYDLSVSSGTLTINKRLLTLTATDASKVYDGKLTSADKPLISGRQRGDSIVGLTQSYLDKNAGTGKTINVNAGYTIRDGNNGNNYDVVIVNSTAGVITPKALTISTVANSKVYDGGLTSANKPLVTGLVTGDSVSGLFQQYETKTVGENKKLLLKAGYVVRDGNDGGNYSVTEQGSMDGVITAH